MQVGTQRSEKGGKHEWYKAIVLVVGWLLIISLVKDVWQMKEGFDRIKEADRRLEAERTKNETLKAKLELSLTESYKEVIIREKLNMQKEGEVIVVLPKKQEQGLTNEATESAEGVPNWEKWWSLIN